MAILSFSAQEFSTSAAQSNSNKREISIQHAYWRLQALSWELWNMELSLSDWEDYSIWPPSAQEIQTLSHFYKWDFTTILQVVFWFKCSHLVYFVINSVLPVFVSALTISGVSPQWGGFALEIPRLWAPKDW